MAVEPKLLSDMDADERLEWAAWLVYAEKRDDELDRCDDDDGED